MLKQLFKTYYPAFIILLILVSFTLFAFYQSAVSAENRRTRLFELRVQQARDAVQKRLTDYIQILKGCQGLFYAADTVSHAEWNAYADNLQVERNYPGIQALAFAKYIPKGEVQKLESEMRRTGFPEFRINSDLRNSHLTPIIFIRPMNTMNRRAFGYDMYSESNRREAMDRAMMSGEASMTRAKVTLVQEASRNVQPGFLLYLPVYDRSSEVRSAADRKKLIRGFVYNAFRAHDLMRAILADFSDIEIDLYASPDISRDNLLYSSRHPLPGGKEKEYTAQSDIRIAGAVWRMAVASKNGFGSRIEKRQPYLILIFGLAISGLMFAISVSNLKRRSEIVEELNLTKRLEMKKDEFIGIASHELKTPLTSIKAYIQLLDKSKLGDKERTFVQKANANVRKLNYLISDLLDVSKIQAGRLQFNFAPFSLREMVEESMENVQHMYSSHRIIAESPIPDVTVTGDKLRLEQALTNFLVNAVKYSPGADLVTVNTAVTGQEVTIAVTDQGIGVPEYYRDHIFDRFYRVDSVSPVISGLGVGLYITNEIIMRHHGRVGLRNNRDKGSTFFFCIPVNGPARQ
ncbi:MAG TPA: CHASE domain-containing protein [Sphingobacteriaceae bacterium]